MSRTLHWNDSYCPNGHVWQFVPSSGLYPDYYYCRVDDTLWQPTIEIILESDIADKYNTERPERMKKHAKFLSWQESLTPKDMPKEDTK